MHSFLVNTFPIIKPGPDLLEILPETSIGIDDIRQIKIFLSRKPIASDHNTVVIQMAEKLTLPAQHALLKTLEEPPGNSIIYMVTDHPDQLLPTILSRVQITMKQSNNETINVDSNNLIIKLLESKKVGEKINLLNEKNFTRETFLEFLDHIETIMHSEISSPSLRLREGLGVSYFLNDKYYDLIVSTRQYLKSNVNLKLITTHFCSHLV